MKLYLIKNIQYNDRKVDRKVAAENMEQALSKYRKYLSDSSIDYSSEEVFENVTECKYLGEYYDEDIIK